MISGKSKYFSKLIDWHQDNLYLFLRMKAFCWVWKQNLQIEK